VVGIAEACIVSALYEVGENVSLGLVEVEACGC